MDCEIDFYPEDTAEAAIALWNRRAPSTREAELEAEVGRLREALQQADNFIVDKGFTPNVLLKAIDRALNVTTVEQHNT